MVKGCIGGNGGKGGNGGPGGGGLGGPSIGIAYTGDKPTGGTTLLGNGGPGGAGGPNGNKGDDGKSDGAVPFD